MPTSLDDLMAGLDPARRRKIEDHAAHLIAEEMTLRKLRHARLYRRTSRLTRTDQKFRSLTRSTRWNDSPGADGSTCRSKAVVFATFCSSPVSFARLSVNEAAIRNCMRTRTGPFKHGRAGSLGDSANRRNEGIPREYAAGRSP